MLPFVQARLVSAPIWTWRNPFAKLSAPLRTGV
jgi:hypothetical protein